MEILDYHEVKVVVGHSRGHSIVHLHRHKFWVLQSNWSGWSRLFGGLTRQGSCYHLRGGSCFHLPELRDKLEKKSLRKNVGHRPVSTGNWAIKRSGLRV